MSDPTTAFAALGDPVRRKIVEQLVEAEATVNELAQMFPISLQAVSKHIKVLEGAGIVSRRRDGQTRPVRLEPAALNAPASWLEKHRRRIETRYEQLDELLEDMEETDG